MASTTERKEVVVTVYGEDCYVEDVAVATDTLQEMRLLILDQFDDDMIPCASTGGTFAFRVDGRYIQEKQEKRKFMKDLLGAKIELVEKGLRKRPLPPSCLEAGKHEENNETTFPASSIKNKRSKISAITPHEEGGESAPAPSSSRTGGSSTEKELEMSSDKRPNDTDVSDDLTMSPILLDKRLATIPEESVAAMRVNHHLPKTMLDGQETSGHACLLAQKNSEDDDEDSFATAVDTSAAPDDNSDLHEEQLVEKRSSALGSETKADSLEASTAAKPPREGKQVVSSSLSATFASDGDPFPIENDGTDDCSQKDKSDADDDDDDIMEVSEENPHEEADQAKEKCTQTLEQIANMLKENPLFCSDVRRQEWIGEIQMLSTQGAPKTVFGVLGNTGVGKSSLLNALLDEGQVLPTSGSRGCTAAVVELVFHADLAEPEPKYPDTPVPVYRGEVEFITLEDWRKELKLLVDECSTQEKTIYAIVPKEDTQKEAFEAWQKVEQVYGKGFLKDYHGEPSHRVYQMLANHRRVVNLLTPSTPGQEYNSVLVVEGEVMPGSDEAKEVVKPFAKMGRKMRRNKKKWAVDFRKKINSYVYRKGNGDEPQTWPLIRKVQLRGPWDVLSTGAVLVDLPGVRDSNAARAKVAERYLQNCNQIAIVAPIKRAVDDGTAKELMGEQFKRRLLMDGSYGNVFFICTQTDDLEPTETMRDHADVAQQVPGRWEKMSEFSNKISDIEKKITDLEEEETDLTSQLDEAKQEYLDAESDYKEAEKESAQSDDDDEEQFQDPEDLENLAAVVATNKKLYLDAKEKYDSWKRDKGASLPKHHENLLRIQKKLKALCANVRNEYSKSCLQEDFKSGLKELYRKDDDDDGDDANVEETALPEDFNMDVFCISANDYLKVSNIKTSRDGPPNTFSNPWDTQIPHLRKYVHEVTSRFCKTHAQTFVEHTNDILDRVKLMAGDAANVPTGRSAYSMLKAFEAEMAKLQGPISKIADDFKKELDQKVQNSLVRSLEVGARKGSEVAMSTVESWGSKNRRTRLERNPENNGLYWATYQAVVRRNGVFHSGSAGEVDFNQELCDPMEKEFSTDWQSVLDSSIRTRVPAAERVILQKCNDVSQSLASQFRSQGMDATRLNNMVGTSNRATVTAVKTAFQQMLAMAQNSQRELSRTLLPAVQAKMNPTYEAALDVPRGPGTFNRMKYSMAFNSQKAIDGMFDDAMKQLLDGIGSVIKNLSSKIESTSSIIEKSMESVFSICWDDNSSNKSSLMDPAEQKKIRDCRDACLPLLNKLREIQNDASALLGIEMEDLELDVLEVETLDQALARKVEEAKKSGAHFDFCDDSSDEGDAAARSTVNSFFGKVKSEGNTLSRTTTTTTTIRTRVITQAERDVIELLDSDSDDDDLPSLSPFSRQHSSSVSRPQQFRVKSESS